MKFVENIRPDLTTDIVYLAAKGFYAASGSACTSKALKVSPMLLAMGIPAGLAQGSIVFSLGIGNTDEDIEYLLEEFPLVIKRLREISPYARGWGDTKVETCIAKR